jgi:hypothetical protein
VKITKTKINFLCLLRFYDINIYMLMSISMWEWTVWKTCSQMSLYGCLYRTSFVSLIILSMNTQRWNKIKKMVQYRRQVEWVISYEDDFETQRECNNQNNLCRNLWWMCRVRSIVAFMKNKRTNTSETMIPTELSHEKSDHDENKEYWDESKTGIYYCLIANWADKNFIFVQRY